MVGMNPLFCQMGVFLQACAPGAKKLLAVPRPGPSVAERCSAAAEPACAEAACRLHDSVRHLCHTTFSIEESSGHPLNHRRCADRSPGSVLKVGLATHWTAGDMMSCMIASICNLSAGTICTSTLHCTWTTCMHMSAPCRHGDAGNLTLSNRLHSLISIYPEKVWKLSFQASPAARLLLDCASTDVPRPQLGHRVWRPRGWGFERIHTLHCPADIHLHVPHSSTCKYAIDSAMRACWCMST